MTTIAGIPTRILGGAVLLLILALAGCETLTVSDDGFVPLDDAAAAQTLRRITRATSGWQTVKVKLACTFVMRRDGDLHTETAAGICLWQPGRALRVRFSKLGMSVAEVLYNGRFWFITDEPGGAIYVCRRIERARMPGIPPVFFQQLQTMPQGWLAGLAPGAEVAASDAAVRIIDRPRGATRTLVFRKGAGMPSQVDLAADDGSAFRATLAAPNPHVAATAATFAPTLGAYAIYDLDRREWIRR